MRTLLFRLFLLAFVLSSALYAMSVLAPFIDPRDMIIPAFAGLLFPWLFIIQLLWILLWLPVRRRWWWLPVGVLLLGIFNIWKYFELPGPSGIGESQTIKVMTWNVKNFDLYSWSTNTQVKNKMMTVIADENPDILVLQEFYTDHTTDFNTLKTLKKTYPYVHVRRTISPLNPKYWGQATFSKFPMVRKETIRFANAKHNMVFISDVVVGKDTLSIYNLHLQSIYFDEADYQGMEEANNGNLERLPLRQILGKLHIAFEKRAFQADSIRQHMDANTHKYIVCGDFNDTPNSYTYRVLSKGNTDAFLESGSGFCRTYNGPFPAIRIDHVLYSKGIRSGTFRVLDIDALSDHQPLVTEVVVE